MCACAAMLAIGGQRMLTAYRMMSVIAALISPTLFARCAASLLAEPWGRTRAAVVLSPGVACAGRSEASCMVIRVKRTIAAHTIELECVPRSTGGHRPDLNPVMPIIVSAVVLEGGA